MAKRIEMEIPDRVNLVAKGTVLEGTLHVAGDVRINGRIIGSVEVEERIVMGPDGIVEGDLIAAEADLAGVVQGGVEVTERLVLRQEAYIAGTIKAGHLVIEDGAVFNGTCQMGPSIWVTQEGTGAFQGAVASLDDESSAEEKLPSTDPVESEEVLASPPLVVPGSLPEAEFLVDRLAENPEAVEAQTSGEPPEEASPIDEPPEEASPIDEPEQANVSHSAEAETPPVAPESVRSAKRLRPPLRGKRTPGSPSLASHISALSGMFKKNAERLTTPGVAGGVLAAAFGAVLVLYLIFGGFSSMFSRPEPAADPVVQPAQQITASDTPVAETNTPSDPDAALAMTDVGGEVVNPAESAATETEAARQTAEQQRATMEQARRRVAARLDEQEVQALAQQAETARRTGMRALAAEDFEQATRSFQSANRLFQQIKTTLDAKDQALADAAEPAASDPAESTAEELEEQTEATQPVEPEPAPELPSAQPAVRRLAGYLKSNIEQENAGGMQALFHRGWEPFFEQADGIRATVRPGTAEVKGSYAKSKGLPLVTPSICLKVTMTHSSRIALSSILTVLIVVGIYGSITGCDQTHTSVVSPQVLVENGAWTWFNDERSIFAGAQLYIGFVDTAGYSSVTVYPLETNEDVQTYRLGSFQEKDDHNNPAFVQVGEGPILAAYAPHHTHPFWYWRFVEGTESGSIHWSQEQKTEQLDANTTYSNLIQLAGEDGRLYNFFRGTNFDPVFMISDDDGHTWGAVQHVIASGGPETRPYVKYASNGMDRIDMLFTQAHPRDAET
ncbi:MAG TPA: polymer-forming cytoskeletal protein, partial [Rhodothermales bacterium]|nr:polymer-forming cytoskeletal protein [Rhodothermales bacterium]